MKEVRHTQQAGRDVKPSEIYQERSSRKEAAARPVVMAEALVHFQAVVCINQDNSQLNVNSVGCSEQSVIKQSL